MASTKELKVVITTEDKASAPLQNIGKSFFKAQLAVEALKGALNLLKSAAGLAIDVLKKVTAATIEFGKESLKLAGDMEMNRVAFETMLGSAEAAGDMLKQISDFARTTPFDLPGVVDASKMLLAMGSSAEQVIPELKMMGDVAAGLGVPLERLILNFGQVRTQGKLTGRELRDFNVAGVPLIDTLVELGNAGKLSAGSVQIVGATSDATRKKIATLTSTIEKQTRRYDEMKDAGKKGTASYKNLNQTLEENRDKLSALGPVTDGYAQKIVYTKEAIADLVSEGKIGFEDVKLAFEMMTQEGGRFEDLMERQSNTMPGIIENIKDGFIRLRLALVGMTETGDILEGGFFDVIKGGLQQVKFYLDALTLGLQAFLTGNLESLVAYMPIFGNGIQGVTTTMSLLDEQVTVTDNKMKSVAARFVMLFQKADEVLKPALIRLKDATFELIKEVLGLDEESYNLGATLEDKVFAALELVLQKITDFINYIVDNKDEIANIATGFMNLAIWIAEAAANLGKLIKLMSEYSKGKKPSFGLNIPKFSSNKHGGTVPGGFNEAVPTILHGGERVIPKTGLDVNSRSSSSGGLTINFNGSIGVRSENDINEIAQTIKRMLNREDVLFAKGVY